MIKIEQGEFRLLACLNGVPRAMPRTARKYLWADTAAYHVINRGHNRETVFGNDEEMAYFLTLLGRYRDRFDAQIYHYCLMSNHFHLLLRLPQPQRLSSFMAGLLRSYVHFYHQRRGFVGHLWQGRFKSPVVQREGYWLSCGRYIERNPQEAGLVARPWEYRWSSAAVYALGRSDPLVRELNPCYLDLADQASDRRKTWQELLLSADPLEQDVRRAEHFLGDEGFGQGFQQERGRSVRRRRGRPAKDATGSPTKAGAI